MKTINYEFRIILCYSSANNTRGTQYFNRYFLILETTTTQYIPQDIDDRVCDRLCTVCAVDDDDDDDNKSSKYGGIQLGKFLPETILSIFSNVTHIIFGFTKIEVSNPCITSRYQQLFGQIQNNVRSYWIFSDT